MLTQIYGFTGDHDFLSNFHQESDGKTLEHRFQAAKTDDPVWRARIMDAPTPAKAKYHGRSVPLCEGWDEIRFQVMRALVAQKFEDPKLRRQLLSTGDTEIIEANSWGDTTWGVDTGSGRGQNRLGKILVEERTRIRRLLVTEPLGVKLSAEGRILVATDGSTAPRNPGPSAWAWYVNDDCWAATAVIHSTNNRAELAAVLNLFRATAELALPLHILCDSQYAIGALQGNRANKNADLIERLREVARGRDYALEWVRGHQGHPMNEAVDGKCGAATAAFNAGAAVEKGPGWTLGGVPSQVATGSEVQAGR